MKLRSSALSALALGLALAAGSASAANTTGSFDVSATVGGSCVIAAADTIGFGTYDPTAAHASTNLDAQGKVAVRCTAGSSDVKVALDDGINADAGSTAGAPLRRMNSGANFISYGIFQDSGRANVWGADAATESNIASFASSLVPVELVTYGRIPGGQNAAIGTYADTVGVNVTF